jgi:nitroreductase
MCQGDKEMSEIIAGRRSIRQFRPEPVARELLEKLIDLARLAPSAANLQPLEFILIDDKGLCPEVFACLKWAAYIVPEGNPKPGNEPVAYVVTLVKTPETEKRFDPVALEKFNVVTVEEPAAKVPPVKV